MPMNFEWKAAFFRDERTLNRIIYCQTFPFPFVSKQWFRTLLLPGREAQWGERPFFSLSVALGEVSKTTLKASAGHFHSRMPRRMLRITSTWDIWVRLQPTQATTIQLNARQLRRGSEEAARRVKTYLEALQQLLSKQLLLCLP